MKIFYTNAMAKIEIARLEDENGNLSATISAKDAEIAELTAAVESIEADLTLSKASLESAIESASIAVTESARITVETSAALAEFDARVESAAASRFAGLGGDPITESGSGEKAPTLSSGLTGFARVSAAFSKKI